MNKNIKLIKLNLILSSAILAFASCQSTSQESTKPVTSKSSAQNEIVIEQSEKPKVNFDNVKISLVSNANVPIATVPFKTPFVVCVKDNQGNPLKNYPITVTYPASKNDNVITFAKQDINTDENGNVIFKPEPFQTSVNSTITFAPKANGVMQEKAAKKVQLELPFKVKFNSNKKGIVINLIDYDEKDKMILNSALSTSSNLLGEFWRSGYTTAQNADFHKVIDNGSEAICLAAKKLFQGSTYFRYIIYGKIKYASQITKVENGYTLTLKGTATVINYTTGQEICTITKTTTVTDKNQWNVLKACQTQLAKDLANELIYSM